MSGAGARCGLPRAQAGTTLGPGTVRRRNRRAMCRRILRNDANAGLRSRPVDDMTNLRFVGRCRGALNHVAIGIVGLEGDRETIEPVRESGSVAVAVAI